MANVSGLAELNAAIAALKADLRRELPAVAMAGADIVAAEIEPRIPRRTGELAASLDEEPGAGRNSASATVEIVQSGPGGQEHKAIFLEYGTSKMPAHPFFRPGVEAAKPKVEAALVAGIQNVIAKHDR
jgi:HK97 gp10 family phage protein